VTDEISQGLIAFKQVIDLLRNATGLVKDVKDTLPEGEKKRTIESSLAAIDENTAIAEVTIAKALNYNLCQCTFPPQIMTSIGIYEESYKMVEKFQCPKCEKIIPPTPPKLPEVRASFEPLA